MGDTKAVGGWQGHSGQLTTEGCLRGMRLLDVQLARLLQLTRLFAVDEAAAADEAAAVNEAAAVENVCSWQD